MFHGGGGGWARGDRDLDEESGRLYDNRVIVRIIAYMRPYLRVSTISLFIIFVYTAATVAIPPTVGRAVRYIETGDISGLDLTVGLLLLILVAHYASNYSHQAILARVTQRILYDLRFDLFTHLQRLSMSFHGRNKVGSLMSRAQNDVFQLQEFFNLVVMSVADVLSLLGIAGVMFYMNARLAALTLATLPVLIIAIAIWQRYAKAAFLNVRFAIARVNGALQENISGVRVVQSMNRQQSNMTRFDELNRDNLKANVRAANLSASLMPTVEMFTGLGLAAIIVFGGQMVLGGSLDRGELVAFALFIQRFFDPIRQLTMQFSQLQRAMAAGDRVFDLLDVEPELKDAPNARPLPAIQGEVRYENVSFEYSEGKPVLRDVDLHVLPGQTVALVGRTGAGKTTMVGLLARFFDPTQGTITIDGHDLRSVTRRSLALQTGMVLQEPFLFTGTVKENIRYSHTEATDQAIEAAAQAVGIHDFIVNLPDGYDTMMEERGANLSIGQRQLISFARALVADPRIIILDEATANVDTQTEQTIQQAIGTLLHGRTAVVIAHRLSTIRNADQIVVMADGRIVEQGKHDELVALNGFYARQYALHQGTQAPA